jgi:flagellar hook-associated protein 2
MTTTTTVDGLVSGLDTTSIINQLISLQAAPQNQLKSTLSSTQAEVNGLQSINTKMSALQTAAEKLGQASTWGAVAATSSAASVTATAASGALVGSLTFDVTGLAAAKSSVSSQTWSSTTASGAFTDSPIEIHAADGSLRASITPKGTSLGDVVKAINASTTAGVTASAVQVSPGSYRLQLTAKSPGTANDFSVTGAGGAPLASGLTFDTATAARNATLHVGDAGSGYDVTSSSNTFEGLMPGLTLKVSALQSGVTVQTSKDTTSITAAVQAVVDALNAALSSIGNQTSAGTVSASGSRSGVGALAGDSGMRSLSTSLLNTVTHGVGGKSLAALGIATTRDGSITFDATKFGTALQADPAGVQATFSAPSGTATGFATTVAALAKRTSSSSGTIASAIQGRTSTIKDLNQRIADWDDRLAASKEALQRQYASLETTLSKMQSQATWLNGQISALG